ncbi:hypothetical protein PENTCL1PPCAC_26954, partial [Pristionchus entomophagus]
LRMAILLGLLLVPAVLSQALYGINQLDSYSRIIQSNNVAGLGLLNDAIARGKVHNVQTEVLGTPKLSGLPPLPEHAVQRGTPLLDSDALAPPRRVVQKRVNSEQTTTPPSNIWGVNPNPELPQDTRARLGGFYDEDGEFHEYEKKKEGKKRENKRKISEDDEIPHVITPIGRIDESPHPISSSRHVFTAPSSPQRASKLERRVRRVRQQQQQLQQQQPHRAVPRQVAPASTPPPFVYRPKPKPFDRATDDNNLLAEVEEYDDWLDQREGISVSLPRSSCL